jgi:hypothetical protein
MVALRDGRAQGIQKFKPPPGGGRVGSSGPQMQSRRTLAAAAALLLAAAAHVPQECRHAGLKPEGLLSGFLGRGLGQSSPRAGAHQIELGRGAGALGGARRGRRRRRVGRVRGGEARVGVGGGRGGGRAAFAGGSRRGGGACGKSSVAVSGCARQAGRLPPGALFSMRSAEWTADERAQRSAVPGAWAVAIASGAAAASWACSGVKALGSGCADASGRLQPPHRRGGRTGSGCWGAAARRPVDAC